MAEESPDYEKLSASTGLDFNAIRLKYINQKQSHSSEPVPVPHNDEKQKHIQYSNAILENYVCCQRCLGSGIRQGI